MVRIVSRLFATLALFAALAAVPRSGAQAQGPAKASPALLKMLQELGYRYEVQDNGLIVVEVPGEDGTVSAVFLTPLQEDAQGDAHTTVMVPVTAFKGQVSQSLMQLLKAINADLPQGVNLSLLQSNSGDSILLVKVKVTFEGGVSAKGLSNLLRVATQLSHQVKAALKNSQHNS